MIYYNPLDTNCKSRLGAIKCGEKTEFRIKADFDVCYLVLHKDHFRDDEYYEMHRLNDGDFFVELSFEVGLYWYYFDFKNGQFLGLGSEYLGILTDKPTGFQLTVYDENYFVTPILKGGIIYQIFPDRFNFSGEKKDGKDRLIHKNLNDIPLYMPNEKGEILNNDFFGGDIKGITLKLDYLKRLNVTAIYLNPIQEAYSNHRYDTADYNKIDSLLGTEEDFKCLIEEAKKRDIFIIMDGVFNHTGADSIYFNKYGNYGSGGAFLDKNSPYFSWYDFSVYPNTYSCWWGIKTLPQINKKDSGTFSEFIAGENGVIEHFTKLGVKGWRLDVVDELTDDFVKKIRSAIKRVDKNAIVIGEVWEDATNKISYGERREYFLGKELDSIMNYTLKDAIIEFVRNGKAKNLGYIIKEQIDHYPQNALNSLMNILSTHDTVRILTALGGIDMTGKERKEKAFVKIDKADFENAVTKLKKASLLQFTLCGVPCIYYGDEAGMEGYEDPFNRRFFPWGKENKDIADWYKFLGKVREEYTSLSDGKYKELYLDDNMIVFERSNGYDGLCVAINNGLGEYILRFNGCLFDLINGKEIYNEIKVYPNEFVILGNKKV